MFEFSALQYRGDGMRSLFLSHALAYGVACHIVISYGQASLFSAKMQQTTVFSSMQRAACSVPGYDLERIIEHFSLFGL